MLAVAALAVILFVPRETPELAVSTFRLARVPASSMVTPWRSGHRFEAQVELTLPGYPVLFHVDSRGKTALLHPPTADTPLSVVAGEMATRLPGGTESWKLTGAPGKETFLLAVSPQPEVILTDLQERLAETAAEQGTPEQAVTAVQQLLEQEVGPVRIQTLHIQP